MDARVVPLVRRFAAVPDDADTADEEAIRIRSGLSKAFDWVDLLAAYRTVVLAGAGSGKTFELRSQAEQLRAKNRRAFFTRIEDINADLPNGCKIRTSKDLSEWLASEDEAWFF